MATFIKINFEECHGPHASRCRVYHPEHVGKEIPTGRHTAPSVAAESSIFLPALTHQVFTELYIGSEYCAGVLDLRVVTGTGKSNDSNPWDLVSQACDHMCSRDRVIGSVYDQ